MNISILSSGKENAVIVRRIRYARILVQASVIALLLAGLYVDIVKPIAMVVFVLTFLLGNFFCGWICPFGTLQDLFSRIGSLFVKRKLKMPHTLQKYAQFIRYILFAAMLIIGVNAVLAIVPINAYRTFFDIISGKTIQQAAVAIMALFLLSSLFVERAFCNYFCSEAVRYGLASLLRIFTVKREPASCIGCKKCDKVCPANIEVSAASQVRNSLCINCFACISACPSRDALKYGLIKWKSK